MSSKTISLSEAGAFALPGGSVAIGRIAPRRRRAGRRLLFWPAECLRLIGVVYLFPVVILAIGVPLALALNGLLMAAQWMATFLP